MMTREQERKADALRRMGFIVGDRDPRLNMAFKGTSMVVQQHDESELPTESAANGPWCVVGDNLGELVDCAYSQWGE